MTYSDGAKYDGKWKNNLPNGEGKVTYFKKFEQHEKGKIMEGNFKDGIWNGVFKISYTDGEVDVGVTNNRFRCANFSCNIYGKYLHSSTYVYAGSCMCSAILCATSSMKAPTVCATSILTSPKLCLAGDPSGDMANGVTLGRTGGLPQALWGESGSTTGRIEIGLPTVDGQGNSNHHGMVHVAIDVYEYNNKINQFYIYASGEKFISNTTALKKIKSENTEELVKGFINTLIYENIECAAKKK